MVVVVGAIVKRTNRFVCIWILVVCVCVSGVDISLRKLLFVWLATRMAFVWLKHDWSS